MQTDLIIQGEIPKPIIPDNVDARELLDKLKIGYKDIRRMGGDFVSWLFVLKQLTYSRGKNKGENSPSLLTWKAACKEIGIHHDTANTKFKELGWMSSNVLVTKHTGKNEWFTPLKYIDAAKHTMGTIDLDPASNETAQNIIKAGIYYTEQTNGLDKEWTGNIWLNPPYEANIIKAFVNKLITSNISQGIVLTNNNTDTKWFKILANWADLICFTYGRISFYDVDDNLSSPTNGQTFFYKGVNEGLFINNFKEIGLILKK